MVMPSSFSTMLNQASRCAFWKAPPQDETVRLCCATLSLAASIVTAPNSAATANDDFLHGLPLRPFDAERDDLVSEVHRIARTRKSRKSSFCVSGGVQSGQAIGADA